MAVLEIVLAPDPVLKTPTRPVAAVDARVRRLMDDMLETMYAAPGIGLAAPQVGVLDRVLVCDVAGEGEAPRPLRMANPQVLWRSDTKVTAQEGCLSFPDHYVDVTRRDAVRVAYLDQDGAEQTVEADGLLARCLQHEVDHLDGIVFTDHVSALKRGIILRKMTKLKKAKRAA